MDNSILTDIEVLRASLVEETGPAAFAASPWAVADVAALEGAGPRELVHEAERRGWDLRRFEAGGRAARPATSWGG